MALLKMRLRGVLAIMCMCGWLVGCSGGEMKETGQRGDTFLVRFDRTDLQRMEKFVARFHDRKGDYLMAIPLTLEGGAVIYDLRSDGRKIDIMIDNTRDGYASDRGQTKLVCGDIAIEKASRSGEIYTDVLVSDCEPSDAGDVIRLFSFARDQ